MMTIDNGQADAQEVLPLQSGQGLESPAELNLSRQLRNLLLTRPLTELAARSQRNTNGSPRLEGIDTNYLALALFDFVMSSCAFGNGPTHRELEGCLSAHARLMKDSLSQEVALEIAAEVIEALHNERNFAKPFEYTYFDAHAREMRTYAFRLLNFTRGDDGENRYSVTDEGQLVYLGMLDLGAEDMQMLMQKMLAELVKRGLVDKALDVSQQAYWQASRYKSKILEHLRNAQRRPDTLKFEEDVRPVLDNARKHIDERQRDERQLLEMLTERLRATREHGTRDRLIRLKETVEKENALLQNLLRTVVESGQKFRDANNSLFRARQRQSLPSLEDEVLPALLRVPMDSLMGIADDGLYAFGSVKRQKVFNLAQVLALLCAPPPVVSQGPEEDAELVEAPTFEPKFPAGEIAAADTFLDQYFATHANSDIEELLKAAEDQNLSDAARQYMTFVLYRGFSRDESTLPVSVHADGRFSTALVQGTRLHFTPTN